MTNKLVHLKDGTTFLVEGVSNTYVDEGVLFLCDCTGLTLAAFNIGEFAYMIQEDGEEEDDE